MALPEEFSPALATELAIQIRPVPEILERYSLDAAELAALMKNPAFQALFAEAKARWTSDLSAPDRVRLKAAIISEDVLPVVHKMILQHETPAGARVDAFKTINRLAQLDTPEKGGGGDGRFVININLGDGHEERLVIDNDAPTMEPRRVQQEARYSGSAKSLQQVRPVDNSDLDYP